MIAYTLYSVDMWGHVPNDCPDHRCPCMHDDGAHDDDRCDCHEDMNNTHRLGTLEVPEDSEPRLDWRSYARDAIVEALYSAGYLNELGRKEARLGDDYDQGGPFRIEDAQGRCLFLLEGNDE